ncbi:MAG: phosphate signaling complex protein PhoU [Anaerolineales bacterium]
MARETLDLKIQQILNQILVMGSMVESATLDAVQALKKQDLEFANTVYNNDARINEKHFEIEEETIRTIATQQPIMAGDLRVLASVLEVNTELERMGDYAKGIAKICLIIGKQPLLKPLIDVPRMAEISVAMLHDALTAFVNRDNAAARAIPKRDDEVDGLYNQVYRELVTYMISDPSTIDRANYLMWVAHNLERLADRVTNICERTLYVSEGILIEIDQTDDEMRMTRPGKNDT